MGGDVLRHRNEIPGKLEERWIWRMVLRYVRLFYPQSGRGILGLCIWQIFRASVEGIYTQDIQKTIQSWESDDQSSIYGFYCSPMSHCEANLDKDQCLDPEHPIRPALYFVMWSIANLNNWMDSLLTAVDHTASIADARAADMVNTFATNMENIVSECLSHLQSHAYLTNWIPSLSSMPVLPWLPVS